MSDVQTEERARSGPAELPPIYLDRAEVAARYLAGEGLEIGALHFPLDLPPQARARYVDRMEVEQLRREYPELDDKELTPVDVIDDGERLTTIPDGSQDFIVANGFLEHCEDPIGTLQTHLGKIKPGGVLFYAVPDKRYTFDWRRPLTPLDHMILDHEEGPERSRSQHYEEWTRLVPDEIESEEWVARTARELEESRYSIHTHVWTQAEFLKLVLYCRERFEQAFDIEACVRRSIELIVVLRKRGPFPDPHPPPAATAPAPLAAPPAPPAPAPAGPATAIPLTALRPALDGGWPRDARWLPAVAIGSRERPALLQPTDTAIAFRLRCGPGARLRAWASLPADAWRLAGGASLRAVLRDGDGRETEVWSGFVGGFWRPRGRRWVRVDAPLDAVDGDVDLVLSAAPVSLGGSAAGHVLWGDPTIHVASPRTLPEPPPADAPGPLRWEPRGAPCPDGPLISILTPVHDPDPAILRDTLASVRRQTFGTWELCLVDDGSSDPRVVEMLERAVADDERVRLVRREQAGGIASATNAALEMARGDYVALLDHDDLLADDALELVAEAIADHPDADMLYSDEDLIDRGERVWLYLKPDWSPDFLRSVMYTCHLGVYRRSLATAVGGFRSEFDGAQDYDFVLRVTERTDRIVHVPRVLYRWRAHERSAARSTEAKPYAYAAARRAIAAHLERAGIDAEAGFGAARGEYRLVHRVQAASRTAVILPVPRVDPALARALESSRPQVEIVLCGPSEALHACAPAEGMRIVETEPGLARGALANRAAAATNADHLVLLDAPVETLTRDWLERIVGFATQPGVGAAAAKVIAADGRIEHAGIVLVDGLPMPVLYGADGREPGLLGVARVPSNVSAVSGVVAIGRETLERLGGMDEQLDQLAEIDFCLRARDRGLRIVSVPDAIVRRVDGVPPVADADELAAFRLRWRDRLGPDPYYNPGFQRHRADFAAGDDA